VGKSSLLNRLAGSGVNEGAFVADQPFATLDPTLRRAYVAPGLNVRLADTVGFITALPQELVNAFRATLEELENADLLLHVSDASNPDWPRQKASVETILRESERFGNQRWAEGQSAQVEFVSANPTGRTQDPSTYIGNGPFVMTEWVHQDHITLVPNTNYNGTPPKLQKPLVPVVSIAGFSFQRTTTFAIPGSLSWRTPSSFVSSKTQPCTAPPTGVNVGVGVNPAAVAV